LTSLIDIRCSPLFDAIKPASVFTHSDVQVRGSEKLVDLPDESLQAGICRLGRAIGEEDVLKNFRRNAALAGALDHVEDVRTLRRQTHAVAHQHPLTAMRACVVGGHSMASKRGNTIA
jgi:hypothetical protein